ncbi:MAG: DUF4376 domain-containing protein [Alphaproteobacteria bacterium]|jgi:hypothetical protein|nr:DUF4376 domain-containing protein [Alphaproteobacteria bacterium]
MAYVKIENNIVVQKQPDEAEGFIEAPDDVVPGYIYEDGSFTPPPHTPDLKAVLADWRYGVETGGITVAGVEIQTDRESRGNLMAAHIMASEDANYSVTWKTAQGFTTLDAQAILTISAAVRQHVETCFAVEKIVSDLIDTEAVNRPQEVQDRFMNGMAEMASE